MLVEEEHEGTVVAAERLMDAPLPKPAPQPQATPETPYYGAPLDGIPDLPGVFMRGPKPPPVTPLQVEQEPEEEQVAEGTNGFGHAEEVLEALVAENKLTVENVRGLIVQECNALCELLLEKNTAYGNSALDPVRLFSKSSPVEQLLVRIDDKISRIARGDFTKVRDEDLKVVTKDLLGYLILIRVAWRLGLA